MAKPPVGTEIIDFKSAQQDKLEEKRRKNQRIIFKNMIGVYGVTGDEKLKSIELLDLSDAGISFRTPFNAENLWPSDTAELTIRLYFTQDTYIPLRVKIQNSKSMIEEGIKYTRYGCLVENSGSSFEAYKKFVEFMKAYSTNSYQDQGGVQVFYI